MIPHFTTRKRVGKSFILGLFVVLAMVLLSACGGDPQVQQQASKSLSELNASLVQARTIGVPADMLQPIIAQEQQLEGVHSPLPLFGSQTVDDYYTDLALRYAQLYTQVVGMESQLTQQYDYQASQDLQTLSNVLAERQGQNLTEAQPFATRLNDYQQQLNKAQYPKDYLQIITNAQNSTDALRLMGPAYDALNGLQKVITQLQASSIDTTLFADEYQSDLQNFRSATLPADFSQLITLVNSQMDETATVDAVAIPYVGKVKLGQYSADIQLIKQYGGADISTYQQHLQADQQALNAAQNIGDFLKVSTQIDADIAAIQIPLVKAQAHYLLQSFHSEVQSWGQAHQYHDSFNGQSYPLDYEYADAGVGSDADAAVAAAQTPDDYQAAIDLINNNILELHMMEQDYGDSTAYNQPHASDMTLMRHFGISSAGEVLVVSLIEETLRYYQNGKLIRSFHITSGQYALPSPPGRWQIFLRESPTVFKSSEPKGSAFWYPDTQINFAMEYHSGGYFFHDSWWRADYGVGTNFPHNDSGGDESFSGDGSHGCINMAENDISWLYANSVYGAQVILY